MNKIVIFDWGGVILKEYPEHYCDQDAIKETISRINVTLKHAKNFPEYILFKN